MKHIVLEFYKGNGKWATAVDKAILLVSKPHVHVEAKFENALSFSSSQRAVEAGGNQEDKRVEGVRYKGIKYTNTKRWTEIILCVTDEEYRRIKLTCDVLVAMHIGYDIRGAIGTVFTGKQDPDKYFCSEVIYDAILSQWLPQGLNHKMHPQKLYDIVEVLAPALASRFGV